MCPFVCKQHGYVFFGDRSKEMCERRINVRDLISSTMLLKEGEREREDGSEKDRDEVGKKRHTT